MIVKELIEKLQQYDLDMIVLMDIDWATANITKVTQQGNKVILEL
jgi:hypothetical protein